MGVSGDLAYAAASPSGCAPIAPMDQALARVLCTLADSSFGNPASTLQHLLNFSSEDYSDLLSALSESGCSYVDILGCYLHNIRVMSEDAGSSDPAISSMYNQLLQGMAKTAMQGPSPAPPAPIPPAPAPSASTSTPEAMAVLHALLSGASSTTPAAPQLPVMAPQAPQNYNLLAQLLGSTPMAPIAPQPEPGLDLIMAALQTQALQQAMQQPPPPPAAAYLGLGGFPAFDMSALHLMSHHPTAGLCWGM